MFRLWCEWDCGEGNIVFTSEENAKGWFDTNMYNIDAFKSDTEDDPEEFGQTPFDYYADRGFVGLQELKII